MSSPIKVVVFGATGQTGSEIINGLVKSPTNFDIVAVSRPSAVDKPQNSEFREKGVKVVGADITGPREKLVELMRDVDAVITPIYFTALEQQKILADAAKEAGAKRFIPSNFGPVMPPTAMKMRERKEEVINHIKKLKLPYTVIDVAWWAQALHLRLPSGRADYTMHPMTKNLGIGIPGDGNVPAAFADLRSIGPHVAKIIADPRTLNRYVHVYDEVYTHNQIMDMLDELSGEKSIRVYDSAEKLESTIAAAAAALAKDPNDVAGLVNQTVAEYLYSIGVRGDTTPAVADYLGYLDTYQLYPDLKPASMRSYIQEVLDGKGVLRYSGGTQ